MNTKISTRSMLTVTLVLLVSAGQVRSLEVLRGPYVQLATPTSMVVRWRTDNASDSRVKYGMDMNSLTQVESNGDNVTDHEVFLTGLTPFTDYYYTVGSSSEDLTQADEEVFFKTYPLPGTVMDSVRMWVLGDPGWASAQPHQGTTRDAYHEFTGETYTNVLFTLGDNAYQSGTDEEHQVAVFDIYTKLLPQTPYIPSFGNHEAYTSNSTNQTGPYFDIFTLPTQGEAGGVASNTESYFSHDYGRIHFVNLSCCRDLGPDSDMANWLKEDLEANEQDWLIAYFHFAPYSNGSHKSDTEGGMVNTRENFLPILEGAGVDLVMAGHSHNYERSYFIDGHYGVQSEFRDSPDQFLVDGGDGREDGDGAYKKDLGPHNGTVYVVQGVTGWPHSPPDPMHAVMYTGSPGAGTNVLDIVGNRLEYKFLRDDGTVPEYFTMIKGATATPNPEALIFTANAETVPPAQAVTLEVQDGDPGIITATSDQNWLQAAVNGLSITNTANPAGLANGTYTGTVTLTGSNMLALAYTVTLTVDPSNNLKPGVFSALTGADFKVETHPPGLRVKMSITAQGPWQANLFSVGGRLIAGQKGSGPDNFFFDSPLPSKGLYLLKVTAAGSEHLDWVIAR